MLMLCGTLTAQTPFVCGDMVSDYDGYNYHTVLVAGSCWMKENLRAVHYAGGAAIPSASVYHCGNLDDQATNLATYGRLYTWYSAVNVPENSTIAPSVDAEGYVRGACPVGWHIPTMEEMNALRALSADDLRSLNLWLNGENNTNSTGFSALPAGQYTSATSRYEYLLGRTGFWSVDGSALMSSTLNTTMIMNYCDVPLTSPMMKADALSVRCVLGGEAATAEAPTLGATTLVGAVTLSSATISSEVLADGGALVTERGFCWSTASNPTVSGSHISSGSGLGEFTSSLSGLLPNTTYHVRSYAVNSEGVAYGPETTFTTTCGTVNVSISGATSVCAGSSVTLSASGATTYSWNTNPATTSSSTTVSPTATTTYTVEGTDQYGCTGTASHTVTVHNGTFTTVTESACNGYEWYGVNYSESGSYPHEYTNGYGCPSTETLQLTIYKPTHTAVSVSECDSYTWNGTTYTMSGDYIYPHPDEHGCVQVDTLHLTINKPTHTASTVEECDSYTWNGTTYTMSGDYIYPHPDEHGCTQVDTLHLTLTPCAPIITSPKPCTVPSSHPAHTGSDFQGNGHNGANHGLETVTSDGKINSVTDYDGNEYPVVQIGSQCWLAENMRCTHSPKTGHRIVGSPNLSYCSKMASWYTGNVTMNGTSVALDSAACVEHKFGLLYNWCAAMDTANPSNYVELASDADSYNYWTYSYVGTQQGVCPKGWHLPKQEEWDEMCITVGEVERYAYLGDFSGKLASGNDWNNSTSSATPGDYTYEYRNSSNFSAVPAGYFENHEFSEAGNVAYFWTCQQATSYLGYYRYLSYNNARVSRNGSKYMSYGMSVRCLRNELAVQPPVVNIVYSSDVSQTAATLHGGFGNPDDVAIAARGFKYKATDSDTYTTVDATGSDNPFAVTIADLTPSTEYTFCAFVTTATGTIYSETNAFMTLATNPSVTSKNPCTAPSSHLAQTGASYQGNGHNGANHGLETVTSDGKINSVTDYDGNEYPVVQIGSQCWLAENLRCTHSPKSGHRIVVNSSATSYGSKKATWYMNTETLNGNTVTLDSAACVAHKFGLYYNWCAAMDTANPTNYVEIVSSTANNNNAWSYTPSGDQQGICPVGWHVPSHVEWSELENTVNYSAGKLSGGYDWGVSTTPGAPGDYLNSDRNSSGFFAVPAGRFYFSGADVNALWFWSSTEYNNILERARIRELYTDQASTSSYYSFKDFGHSVRCLRDETGNGGEDTPCPTLGDLIGEPGNVLYFPINNYSDTKVDAPNSGYYAYYNAHDNIWSPCLEVTMSNHSDLVSITSDHSLECIIDYSMLQDYAGQTLKIYPFIRLNGCDPDISYCPSASVNLLIPATPPTPSTFTCGDNLTVGSYSYTTHQYGSQCWMTENLRSTNGNYKFEYPDVESSCPNGWRLPDNGDWGALGNVLPSSSVAFGDGDYWTTSYMPLQDGQGNQYTLIAAPYVQSNTVFTSPGVACEVHDAAHGDCQGTISQIYIRCLRDETGGATVTTGNATSVMENTATLNATITNPDNVTITSKGFEYKVSGGTYTTVEGTGDGSSFTADLTGLAAYTQYTYRAFIVYNNNTIYGDEMTFSTTASTPATFTCGDNLTVGSDTYTTHQYGSQCWMTENLRKVSYPDILTACPNGWHLPDDSEWGTLGSNLPSSSVNFGDGDYWTSNGTYPWADDQGNAFTLIVHLFSVQSNSVTYFQTGIACEANDAINCDCNIHEGLNGPCIQFRCVRDESGSTTQAPTVTTGNATDLAEHAATLNATITNPDNVTITSKGFEYKVSGGTYTTVEGTGDGSSFTADLTGLTTFAQYTYRAFIVYDDNTVYGDEQNFWTLMGAPMVTTGSATNITENSATLNATISSNLEDVNLYIFEYKPAGSTYYSWVPGTGNGNSFSADLTGLTAGTEYTYHALISTYDAQVSYGDEMTFTTATTTPATIISVPCDPTAAHPAQTSSNFQGNGYNGANHGLETVTSDGKINSVTDYDGNEYPVVQIGSQCWLAENLRCTHSPSTGTYLVNNQFISGEQIAYTYTGKMARWCNNDSLTNAPQHYGILYNWNAAVDVYNTSFEELNINTNSSNAVGQTFTGDRQGICPNGWHIPNDAEWNTLEAEICGSDWQTNYETAQGYRGTHAGELVTGLWYSGGITQNTTDAYPGNLTYINRNNSGFAALPAGGASDYSECFDEYTRFWSSQQENYNSKKAWTRDLYFGNTSVGRFSQYKFNGSSVRCVRDSE